MKARILFFGILLSAVLSFTSPVSAQSANPQFGVWAGSVFSSAGSSGNMFANSLAPRLNWGISEDLYLEVGTIFSSARFSGFAPYFGMHSYGSELLLFDQPSGMFSTTMYAFGAYQLNPRLIVSGGTWFERTNYDMSQNAMNPYSINHNPRGMMLGLDYKVTENLRFGFEVSASSGISPMAPGLYQRSAFPGGVYNHNPFHRYGRW